PKPVEPAPVKEAPAPAPKPEAPAEPSQTASPPVAPPPAASAPQPPPDAQVNPVSPPAPPAVAKVETPPSPPQPQAKAEPAPAPVRPSTVARKPETPAPSPQPKQASAAKAVPPAAGTGVGYPYSVYLESLQNADNLKGTVQTYESQGLSIYWAKVSLGAKGTWYRLFTGYFRSAQEAEAFIQQKRIKDGEVKQTRYANLIGTFGSRQAGEERVLALTNMGLSAYSIQGADGQVRVYSGAHMNREGAEINQAELNSRGIKSEVVER
ncbi:MAG: SPOR domain-containing protein, partial [Deltaproteobacteria bacterium]